MNVRSFKTAVGEILKAAEIEINGPNPWDIQVHDEHFYSRVLLHGSMGFAESYVDGQWDAERLDEVICKVLKARLNYTLRPWAIKLREVHNRIVNRQTRRKATEVAEVHYDLDNDFYRAMLDEHMAYSCGYWKNASNLRQAQENKMELICRKLRFKPGLRILDIGCGWGSFVKYAATHYGVEAVGINISSEQVKFARENCKGLPVEIRQQDYRDIDEPFDAIVSVGMFEHVGHKNYSEYLATVRRCLTDGGLFLLHTIGALQTDYYVDPWIDKYIFPNGELPSMTQIASACEGLFVIEDVENFGADYDKTLTAWYQNFKRAWPKFRDKFDDRFYRMWKYYLLACAAASRVRQTQLWQLILSPTGVPGGYHRPSLQEMPQELS